MEYSSKQIKDVEVIETVRVGDTYQVKESDQEYLKDRRSYSGKKVRYERRVRADPSSPFNNSIKIKV